MDWGQIQTILTAVFGIVAVVSLIVAVKLARRKKPVWAYETEKIIGLGTNTPPELQLVFNNTVVPDVYRTTVIFYNKGNETIRKSDVNEAITIRLKNGRLLRDPSLLKVSRQQIRVSSTKRGDDSVEIDFSYLDRNDGVVIELLHTQCEEIYCNGDVIGVGRLSKLSQFYYEPSKYARLRLLLNGVSAAAMLTFLILAIVMDWTISTAILILLLVFAFAVEVSSIMGVRSDYLHERFPEWSHSKDNE